MSERRNPQRRHLPADRVGGDSVPPTALKPRITVFVSAKLGAIGWYETDNWHHGFAMKPLAGVPWVIDLAPR